MTERGTPNVFPHTQMHMRAYTHTQRHRCNAPGGSLLILTRC